MSRTYYAVGEFSEDPASARPPDSSYECSAEYRAHFERLMHFGSDSGVGFGTADLAYWAKMPGWTGEEIAALSFGKDPHFVNAWTCGERENSHAFARKFIDRYQLVARSIEVGRLLALTAPCEAVEWMAQTGVQFPTDVALAVDINSGRIVDWELEYEMLLSDARNLEYNNAQLHEHHFDTLDAKDAQIEELNAWVDQARAALRNQDQLIERYANAIVKLQRDADDSRSENSESEHARERDLGARERATFERMLATAMIDGYGFDPKSSRSPIPKQIEDAMALLGVPVVTAETINRKLREAVERHLPQQPDTGPNKPNSRTVKSNSTTRPN